jgi:hypothetical protein
MLSRLLNRARFLRIRGHHGGRAHRARPLRFGVHLLLKAVHCLLEILDFGILVAELAHVLGVCQRRLVLRQQIRRRSALNRVTAARCRHTHDGIARGRVLRLLDHSGQVRHLLLIGRDLLANGRRLQPEALDRLHVRALLFGHLAGMGQAVRLEPIFDLDQLAQRLFNLRLNE